MAQYPITDVRAQSFGPFENVEIPIAKGLNVIVGDNATGKSQLLKLLYANTKALKDATDPPTKRDLNVAIASKLVGTFRPGKVGRLTRRLQGTNRASVLIKYAGIGTPLEFDFGTRAATEVNISKLPPHRLSEDPVYLPSHELLSFANGFVELYDSVVTNFDETWRDTAKLLGRPALRGPRGTAANELLQPFSKLLQGGRVMSFENGDFYLHQPGIGNLEAPLLAEGHRKLAMIVRLIASGVLLEGGYLFWDEPEANLNPASQRAVAHALVHLARQGTQVVVATHSMFLLRELQMSVDDLSTHYIGLTRALRNNVSVGALPVVAQTSSELRDLDYVAALEAEAEQAGRYLAW